MKVTRLKIALIGFATTGIIFGGAAVYAALGPSPKQAYQGEAGTSVTEPIPLDPQPTAAVEPDPIATIEEPVVTEPVAEPAPTSAPSRTFEEIVLDYPNMSTGARGFPECAGHMKSAFPEMFQAHNREENIRRVSQKFLNVCSATDLKMTRGEMTILADYFRNHGVH